MAILALVDHAARRVRREGLTVKPVEELQVFHLEADLLQVPNFDFLNGELLYAAATEGVKHPAVQAYVDSILAFALAEGDAGSRYLAKLRADLDHYHSIEAEILETVKPTTTQLGWEEGLQLVQACCDRLEQQVACLDTAAPLNVLDINE